jgi:hypothetical protein
MAAGVFSRLYRKVMERVLGPLGFQYKGSIFWREREEVLHIISLDRSPFDGSFTVGVAIQPLVFPSETFILSLGTRLDRLDSGIPERWKVPVADSETERVLEQFSQKVVEFAVSWLDRFQSTRDIVEIDMKGTWGVEPLEWVARTEIVGLCALDIGMFGKGEELLRQVYLKSYRNLEESYRELGIDVPKWAHERRQILQELLKFLEDGNREGIQQRLEEYKSYTRVSLGIE